MPLPYLDGYQPQKMVNWYNPPNSIRTGFYTGLGVLFGPYNDRREMQAALDPGGNPFRYDSRNDIWIDFVGDLGDGWHSTFSIAWLLAQRQLAIAGQPPNGDHQLTRGHILVMGGDAVYPTASEENYLTHMQMPYECAFPGPSTSDGPHLFVIPGNHDWYDGLPSFLRTFAQRDEIGGWRTQQARSYFALKLPHGWWLWGVDTQLETEIDYPQREYFERVVANDMRDHDRVILCLHQPAWLHANQDAKIKWGEKRAYGPHQALVTIEDLLTPRQATIAVMLAGHEHHYCRYESPTGASQRITSGGGGAYLHGTHTLERAIPISKRGQFTTFLQASTYPDRTRSRTLRWKNWAFGFRNLLFSCCILGVFYLLHAWVLFAAHLEKPGHTEVEFAGQKIQIEVPKAESFVEVLTHVQPGPSYQDVPLVLPEVLQQYWSVLKQYPGLLIFPLFLWICLGLFCAPPERWDRWTNRSNAFYFWVKATVGGLHALAHIVLNLWLIWLFLSLNLLLVSVLGDTNNWKHQLLFAIEMIGGGGVAAGTLFGLYLIAANLIHFHEDSAFSALRIEDYKNFLRLHITEDGLLEIFPIALDKVCTKWRASRTLEGRLQVTPQDGKIDHRLIEPPIRIDGRPANKDWQSLPLGVGLMFVERMSGTLTVSSVSETATVTFHVVIPDLDAFLCDERHRGILHGDVDIPQVSASLIRNAKGIVELFAPDGNTPLKLLHYRLTFRVGADDYCLDGNKFVEDNPGFDIWKDTTTLYVTLTKNGRSVGTAGDTLRTSLWGVVKAIWSFVAFNQTSWREGWQASGVYLGFFAGELWDVYVRRVKGFLVRYVAISWLIFGGFYLLHAWAIQVGSGNAFVEDVLDDGFGLWTLLKRYQSDLYHHDAWWVLLFPLALIIALTSVRQRHGTPNWLGVAYLQFYPSKWNRFLGVMHAVIHFVLNLLLIGLVAKLVNGITLVWAQRLVFVVAMLVIGGTLAGLIYSVFRQVKLVRPYAG
jgi:hypothetical protein